MIESAATAVVGLLSGVILARVNRRSRVVEAKIPAYDRLDARLARVEDKNDKLEARIDVLETDQRTDRDWITRTITRILTHDVTLVALLTPWPAWFEYVDNRAPEPD